jgi:hypothetical protein
MPNLIMIASVRANRQAREILATSFSFLFWSVSRPIVLRKRLSRFSRSVQMSNDAFTTKEVHLEVILHHINYRLVTSLFFWAPSSGGWEHYFAITQRDRTC